MTINETQPTLDRFIERLADFDVTHSVTTPDSVADAIEEELNPPGIGVELPEGMGSLPPVVETHPAPTDLRAAATGVTEAALGIASYGSVVLPTTPEGVEPVSLFSEKHIAVLDRKKIVPEMSDAVDRLGDRFRQDHESTIIATGSSATADMGALVKGAHGPKTVHVVIVDT